MHGQEERSDPTLRSFTLEEAGGVSDYRGSGARRSSRGFLLLDRETTKEENVGKEAVRGAAAVSAPKTRSRRY